MSTRYAYKNENSPPNISWIHNAKESGETSVIYIPSNILFSSSADGVIVISALKAVQIPEFHQWAFALAYWASLAVQMVKNLPAVHWDPGLIPGPGRSPAVGNHNPLQYSCLRNSMDRGVWWATGNGVTKSDITEQLTQHPIWIYNISSSFFLYVTIVRDHLTCLLRNLYAG